MNLSARSIFLALISTIFIFCGCATKAKAETTEPVRVITSDKIEVRGGLYYEVNQTAPFTGLVQDFYSDGKKKGEANYKDGKRHGMKTLWNKNGQKKVEASFKDGKLHGVATVWDENGKKESESNFKDGEKLVQTLWQNGQKTSERNYKDGQIHGLETIFFKDGQKGIETMYKNGKMHGVQTMRDENGHKILELIYKNGQKLGETRYENGVRKD